MPSGVDVKTLQHVRRSAANSFIAHEGHRGPVRDVCQLVSAASLRVAAILSGDDPRKKQFRCRTSR